MESRTAEKLNQAMERFMKSYLVKNQDGEFVPIYDLFTAAIIPKPGDPACVTCGDNLAMVGQLYDGQCSWCLQATQTAKKPTKRPSPKGAFVDETI